MVYLKMNILGSGQVDAKPFLHVAHVKKVFSALYIILKCLEHLPKKSTATSYQSLFLVGLVGFALILNNIAWHI